MEHTKRSSSVSIKTPASYGIVIVIATFLVFFIGCYPQYQLSPLSVRMMEEMQITSAQYGQIFSATLIPGLSLSLIAGMLCDRYGVKACVGIAVFLAVLGNLLRIWAYAFLPMMICMALSGAASAILNSNVIKLYSMWFDRRKMSGMMGFAMAGSATGMALAMSTSAYFKTLKSAYLFAAILSIFVFLFWVIFAKNSPMPYDKEIQAKTNTISFKGAIKTVMKNPQLWCLGISLMFLMGTSVAFNAYLPMALQTRGISETTSGMMAALSLVGNIMGSIGGPIVCRRIGNVKIYLILFYLLGGAGAATAWLMPEGIFMILTMILTGFFLGGTFPVALSFPAQLDGIGSRYAGTAGGIVSTVQMLGGVCIPSFLIAPFSGDNFIHLFLLAGCSALLGSVFIAKLPKQNVNL